MLVVHHKTLMFITFLKEMEANLRDVNFQLVSRYPTVAVHILVDARVEDARDTQIMKNRSLVNGRPALRRQAGAKNDRIASYKAGRFVHCTKIT